MGFDRFLADVQFAGDEFVLLAGSDQRVISRSRWLRPEYTLDAAA